MRQLPLEISPPPEPTLDNFIAGENRELVARLRELAGGTLKESVLYLWGDSGSGRSHLLRAAAQANPGLVLAVWAAIGVGQALEGMLLTPLIVGKRIGLHPVAVIFALLAFGQVFGFFGVLLALPASAALLVGLRHLRAAYLSSPLYGGR